jgi:energy-converting hydrogenase Eha subunit C
MMNPLAGAVVVPMEGASFFGVTLVGVSSKVGVKLLLTLALLVVVRALRWVSVAAAGKLCEAMSGIRVGSGPDKASRSSPR